MLQPSEGECVQFILLNIYWEVELTKMIINCINFCCDNFPSLAGNALCLRWSRFPNKLPNSLRDGSTILTYSLQ